jgi:hypothetical protein
MAPPFERNPARARAHAAARAYQPPSIRLLVIVEAPADDASRSFYVDPADADDPVFDNFCYVLFEARPEGDKRPYLSAIRRRKVFVLELDRGELPEGAAQRDAAGWLTIRVQDLAPQHVVLVGTRLRDAVGKRMAEAGLPVVPRAVPLPMQSPDVEFARRFRTALVHADLEALIKPLPPAP